MTVEQIIDGCRKGDSDCRRELYERYAKQMFGLVKRYVNNTEAAEDVLHDGFVTLFTKIGDFRSDGSFDGWCRRIFVNASLSAIRRATIHSTDSLSDPIKSSSAATDYGVMEQLSADDIMHCMQLLPEGCRTVMNLRAIEGYSYAEIAEMLSLNESSVRSQFIRARNKLSEMMNKLYGTE